MRCGKRLKLWKTMPTRRQTCRWIAGQAGPGVGVEAQAIDRNRARSNVSSPFRQRRNVLLPPPEGPMITATSPRATASDHPAEDLQRSIPLHQVADLDHSPAPPFAPPRLQPALRPPREPRKRHAHPHVEHRRRQRELQHAPVLLPRIEYCLVSSTSVITEQTEVSLNRAMKSLVTGGITIRTACGTITRRKRQSAATFPARVRPPSARPESPGGPPGRSRPHRRNS